MKVTDEGKEVSVTLTYKEAEKIYLELCSLMDDDRYIAPILIDIKDRLDEYINT